MKKRIRDACSLAFRSGLLLALPIVAIWADSFTTLTGRVIDPSGRVVPGARSSFATWRRFWTSP